MFLGIVFKSFWYNRKNFFVLFSGTVLTVAMILSFMFLKEIYSYVQLTLSDGIINWFMVDAFVPVIIAASIFVIVYMMKFYVLSRMRDYGLLIILGIRKKTLIYFIALEYVIGVLLSMVFGLILGNIIILLLKGLLKNIGIGAVVSSANLIYMYKMTALWCLVLLTGVIFVIAVLLTERELSRLLVMQVRKDNKIKSKFWLMLSVVGIVMVAASFYMLAAFGRGSRNEILMCSVGLCIFGVYLIHSFGISILLEIIKKSRHFYYKNIIWLNNYYYRFKSYKTVLVIQFCIGFLVVSYTTTVFSEGVPKGNEDHYGFDFVCMPETDSDLHKIEEFRMKFEASYVEMPYIVVTTQVGGIYGRFGITSKAFNQIWEESISIRENEFYTLTEELLLFGIYFPETVVLSDTAYQKEIENGQVEKSVIAMNVPKKLLNSATVEMESYDFPSKGVQVISKQNMLEAERTLGYTNWLFCMFSSTLMLLYGLFIIGMKFFAEIPEIKNKYRFLSIIGMTEKQQKKNISKEIFGCFIPQIILTGIMGQLFAITGGWGLHHEELVGTISMPLYYIKWVIGTMVPLAIYCGIQLLYVLWIRQCIFREIKGGDTGENN